MGSLKLRRVEKYIQWMDGVMLIVVGLFDCHVHPSCRLEHRLKTNIADCHETGLASDAVYVFAIRDHTDSS